MEKYIIKGKVEVEVEMVVIRHEKPSEDDITEYISDVLKGYIKGDSIKVSNFEYEAEEDNDSLCFGCQDYIDNDCNSSALCIGGSLNQSIK